MADTSSDAYKLEVVRSALKTLRVESQKRDQAHEEQIQRQNKSFEKERSAFRATIQRLEEHIAKLRSKLGEEGGVTPWNPEEDDAQPSPLPPPAAAANGSDDDNTVARLRVQLQSREATLAALQQETEELRAVLAQREATIVSLQQQTAVLSAKLEEHGRQRGTTDVKLAKLRQRLQEAAVTSALSTPPPLSVGFGVAPTTAEALKAYNRPLPPLKAFDDFVRSLREPDAQPLKQTIDSFVNIFLTRMQQENEHEKIHRFINAMENPLKKLKGKDASQDDMGEVMDCLECYILGQDAVYSRVFGGSHELRVKDMQLSEKMRVLQFIQPQHLDIPPVFRWHPAFALARKEILTVNDVRSPQEKMEVIFRAAKLVLHVLEDRGGESTGSADHFLPVFIYTILKAQVPFLGTNIDYISKFRHPDRLGGERAYYFTQFMSVAQFLESAGPCAFSIDPEYYARMIEMRRRRRNSDPGPLREQQQWCSLHASEWSAAYPLQL